MIPLLLGCIVGGCLDMPIDTRPIHRQIIQDQLTPKDNPIYNREDCEDSYVRRIDPRNRDCRI